MARTGDGHSSTLARAECAARAALAYAAAYPEEIAAALDDEASWTAERVWSTIPFTRPLSMSESL